MTERGMLFSAPMVRALLAGTKTQTRRAAKGVVARHTRTGEALANCDSSGPRVRCPYGQPGDRLWVRETWRSVWMQQPSRPLRYGDVVYRADGFEHDYNVYGPWRPSIFMPRWASRITLELTAVRVERLQEISCADAIAEGCHAVSLYDLDCDSPDPRHEYRHLWESINGAGSWDANPWVWVLTFRRLP